jgi:lipopolysaccharide export system permease protein
MRLLDRYLLRELLVPLGYCLSGFLVLWVVQDLITELSTLQNSKMLPLDILEYYLVKAPEFVVLILPMALLLALLYTLTNLARHHEITAIRAAGVSLSRLCAPYVAVGFTLALLSLVLNELCVPDSGELAERIKSRHIPTQPHASSKNQVLNDGFVNSRDGRLWQFEACDTRTGEMVAPIVLSKMADGSRLWLKADRAALSNGVWTFFNACVSKESPQSNSIPMVLLRTNVLAQPRFSETPDEIRSELKISAMLNTLSLKGVKRADIPISELMNYLRLHPHPNQSAALYTKLQGRLATPWTCLVVVLIATPFGAASGRRNVFVGVASSILIFFAYYVLQQLSLALGAGGTLPSWLAGWLPNIAFGVTGLWLTARVR